MKPTQSTSPDPLPDAIEDALVDALLRSPVQRQERLAAILAGHASLGPEIEARIARLRAEVAGEPADGEPLERIGPFRILDILGQGGMGVVYLAAQEQPVRRQVALKVIKRGMDSRQVLARFELERQALAVMNHPAIANVFDAGTTATGQPYFAMEYVRGATLTEVCDAHRLTLEERIEVFQQVCHGVQHAHQKGVLHRDLKPGNILVAHQGGKFQVKIIDFGLARAIDGRLATDSIHTMHGQLLGTPEYMSPEQAAGDLRRIDTRTDIYSLGVILYELLSGGLPVSSHDLRASSAAELQRKLLDLQPGKPSSKVVVGANSTGLASARRLSGNSLHRRLRGDLDWIVMRAIEKDPERRYQSPLSLALDLARYLDNEPVVAGPPSAMYRVQKFVRRNRGRVVAAGLLLVTLVGGIIGTSIGLRRARVREGEALAQHRRAEAALKSVHEISRWFVVELHDQIQDLPGSLAARRQLVSKGLEYLGELAQQRSGDPELSFDLAQGYLRIGQIQGWPYGPNLGDHDGAVETLHVALGLLDTVAATGPDLGGVAGVRVGVLFRLVDIHTVALERELADQALERAGKTLAAMPGTTSADRRWFDIEWRRARILVASREYADAIAVFEAAEHRLGADLAPLAEARDERLRSLGSFYLAYGALFVNEFDDGVSQNPARALGYFGKAMQANEILQQRYPNSSHARRSVIVARQCLAGPLVRTGELELAVTRLQENVSSLELMLRADPASVWCVRQQLQALQTLARAERDLKQFDAAALTMTGAIATAQQLVNMLPKNPGWERDHAVLFEMLGRIHVHRRDVPAVLAAFAKAFELWKVVETAAQQPGDRDLLLLARKRLVGQLMQLGAMAEQLVELRALRRDIDARLVEAADPQLARDGLGVRGLIGSVLFMLAPTEKDDGRAVVLLEEALDHWRAMKDGHAASGVENLGVSQLDELVEQAQAMLQKRSK